MRDALVTNFKGDEGEALAQSFADAFPLAYINAYSAASAARDVERIMTCLKGDGLALEFSAAKPLRSPSSTSNATRATSTPSFPPSSRCWSTWGCTVIDATPYTVTPHLPLAPVLLRTFTLRVPALNR